MPEIKWNDWFWGTHYDWKDQGEEWSSAWGSSEAQWFGTLYPRLHRYLPAPTILEIAPGFGRWTRFLLPQCNHYYGVDLSPACIDHCTRRFARASQARFVKNDGKSLAFLGKTKLDFVFSFDSLVHADEDVLDTYVAQILPRLSSRGAAFLHHSNAAALNLQEPIPKRGPRHGNDDPARTAGTRRPVAVHQTKAALARSLRSEMQAGEPRGLCPA